MAAIYDPMDCPIEWMEGYFVHPDGMTYQGYTKFDKDTKSSYEGKTLISEGYAYISEIEEPVGDDSNIFIIKAKSVHSKKVETIRIKAIDTADKRLLNGRLLNVFGTDDLGTLNLTVIKAISEKPPKYTRLFRKPQWYEGQLVVPGLGIKDAKFQYLPKVQVHFDARGTSSEGVKALENIVKAFDPLQSLIGIVSFLGAPVIAKLWKGDRYVLVLIATTGTMKTAYITLLNSMYGAGYSEEANLVRWGEGTTKNAATHLAAFTGPFPFVIDNFKMYGKYDLSEIAAIIHGILEGAEKARMQQNSNDLRVSEEYQCIPIITGENWPGDDAASRARGIFLNWSGPRSLEDLTSAQGHIDDLNALGREWCLWLSSDEGKFYMDCMNDRFASTRSKYLRKLGDAINAGRIATNAAILELIWELMGLWPVMAEFVRRHDASLQAAIAEHILQAVEDVNSSIDADKFIGWLRAQVEIGRYGFTSSTKSIVNNMASVSTIIGHYRLNEKKNISELLMLPEILDNILIPDWQRSTNGVRADKKTLRKQLGLRGYLQYDEKNKSFTSERKIKGQNKKVLVFNADEVLPVYDDEVTGVVVAGNQQQATFATNATGVTT